MKSYQFPVSNKNLEQSLKELLCTIRIRENDFITQLQTLTEKEFSTCTTIALYQQKIQSDKFQEILEMFGKVKGIFVNKFWEKLQSLYAISLERIQLLGLNTPAMQEYYEQISKMLKEYKNDIHPLEDVERVQHVIGKKSYYAILGRYREDRKNIIQRNRIDHQLRKSVSVKTHTAKKQVQEAREKLKRNILIGYSPKTQKNQQEGHLKGLQNYFDFKKSYRNLYKKRKTSQLAFEQLLTRNSNIYKTISQHRHLQLSETPSTQYFSHRMVYSQSFEPIQPEQQQYFKQSLHFSPSFRYSFKQSQSLRKQRIQTIRNK